MKDVRRKNGDRLPKPYEHGRSGYQYSNKQKVATIKAGVDYIVNYRQHDRTPAQPSEIIKLGAGGEITIIRK